MPKNLRRVTGLGDLHFITFCCYHRRALLSTAHDRDRAVQILKEVRQRYALPIVGYVIMPEHVHLLIGEPQGATVALVIQVFKQRVSRERRSDEDLSGNVRALRRFWQRRYYDFNVHTRTKMKEKLKYMHANPIKERLVQHPQDGPWSSWSHYATGRGLLDIDAV
jgi:putative transposase